MPSSPMRAVTSYAPRRLPGAMGTGSEENDVIIRRLDPEASSPTRLGGPGREARRAAALRCRLSVQTHGLSGPSIQPSRKSQSYHCIRGDDRDVLPAAGFVSQRAGTDAAVQSLAEQLAARPCVDRKQIHAARLEDQVACGDQVASVRYSRQLDVPDLAPSGRLVSRKHLRR